MHTKGWTEKPQGKRPLATSRRRWDDIKMDLREIEWEGVDWTHLAQDRNQWWVHINTVMNIRVGIYSVSKQIVGSRRMELHGVGSLVTGFSFLRQARSP
jgi:hypothetical protein